MLKMCYIWRFQTEFPLFAKSFSDLFSRDPLSLKLA